MKKIKLKNKNVLPSLKQETHLFIDSEIDLSGEDFFDFKNLFSLSLKAPQFFSLEVLLSLRGLRVLTFRDTKIDLILPLIHQHSGLEYLTIKQAGLEKLPLDFSLLTELKECNLSQNKLTELPLSFSELKKLKRLNLDQNLFRKFPDIIQKTPSLTHLSIDGNPFPEVEKMRIEREYGIIVH